MPTFDVEPERFIVFKIDDEYLFSQYFEQTDVFDDLREYYNDTEYRFEVPEDEFDTVRKRLENAYYEPVVVTELEPYCVVIDKYDDHAEILKQSVATWERDRKRFFLMKDDLAVKEAVERGATHISDTDYVVGL
jgi:hypothetical protein